MKIVDIAPYFHDKSGGIKRYLLEKSSYLKDKPVEHVVILPGRKKNLQYINSTKVYQLPSFPIPMTGGYRFFNSLRDIKEILRIEKPDIVELEGTYLPITALRSLEYRLVVFYHADVRTDLSFVPLTDGIRKKLIEYTINKKLSKADLIITPSKKQEEFLRSYGIENVQTVNLGVDTEVFNPSKRNPYINNLLGVKEETFKVIYSGRLSPEKNIDLLLEVMSMVDGVFFHFILVGDGPLRKKVEKFAKSYPNITYFGYISSKEQLAELYASSDVFLSTSNSETYGLAFLEAQACGCILVAPDLELETQPFKEFLVKDQKPESFYSALVKAVNHQNFYTRQSISAYIQENFSWERTFSRLVEVYNGILYEVI
ncbi:glycosyltransferase [Hydrogenobacter hydrogenophilus]|uniref:Glycosyltransferase involved in cell wall bisynthesis n=1 Tax=Hydrogenobacter hydrogenophilus TaxID=35835 RepID=A0A285NZR9_9AQUI|nr:glycosyltransferase [Hydrogenobacter hydrogenophilus]SNZ14433.1 Glycosyltransferase involved in cell wall bisynthesis [Hydrogenobacter hydrogenophilus]